MRIAQTWFPSSRGHGINEDCVGNIVVFDHIQIGTVRGNAPFLMRGGLNQRDVISLCCSMLLWNRDEAHSLSSKNE